MTLPVPQQRKHLHTRSVSFRGYAREDGLWDIEAEMKDVPAYAQNTAERGTLPPHTAVHDMTIRVTLDDNLTIREISSAMSSSPFAECPRAVDPMQNMVGATMGSGWRLAVENALGGTRGCAHLRELLFNMATAAHQSILTYRAQNAPAGLPPAMDGMPPAHLGKCMSWDLDGPVVKRYYPLFSGWRPTKNKAGNV